MIEHLFNRPPVVADGRLVGILTPSDLVRAFSRAAEEIEREILDDVLDDLCVDPEAVIPSGAPQLSEDCASVQPIHHPPRGKGGAPACSITSV